MCLEIFLSWESENFDWNARNKSEKYLPDSDDPRMVTISNVTLKVSLKIDKKSYHTPVFKTRLAVKK